MLQIECFPSNRFGRGPSTDLSFPWLSLDSDLDSDPEIIPESPTAMRSTESLSPGIPSIETPSASPLDQIYPITIVYPLRRLTVFTVIVSLWVTQRVHKPSFNKISLPVRFL